MTLPEDGVKWASGALRDGRNTQYDTYSDYIDGKQPVEYATDKFRSAFGDLFETFAYNRCSVTVDAHTDRLQIDRFECDDTSLDKDAQLIWDQNRMDVNSGYVEADASGLGDAYAAVELEPESGRVQMWGVAPWEARVLYSEEVPGLIELGCRSWIELDGYRRLNLYFADRIEKYISKNRAASGYIPYGGSFVRHEVDGEPWPVMLNVKDTVPLFHFPNNARQNSYGVSELRDVLPLQDALNKTLMDKLVAMEFAAFPQRVIIGAGEDGVTEDQLKHFQAGITRILELFPPDAKIAEFSPADVSQYLKPAEFWDKAISRVTKVPVHYLEMSADFGSGVARRLAELPFVAKLTDRQRSRGYIWGEVERYGLRLTGRDVAPGAVRPIWQSAAQMTREDELDEALQMVQIGYPIEAVFRQLGHSDAEIADLMAQKADAATAAQAIFAAGNDPFGQAA